MSCCARWVVQAPRQWYPLGLGIVSDRMASEYIYLPGSPWDFELIFFNKLFSFLNVSSKQTNIKSVNNWLVIHLGLHKQWLKREGKVNS